MHKKSIFSLIIGALVGVSGMVMYASASNASVEWSVVGPLGRWADVATAQDGTIAYIASAFGSGNDQAIFKSADGGSMWLDTGAPTLDWVAVDTSPNGQTVTAVGKTPAIAPSSYEMSTNNLIIPPGNNTVRSTDGGVSWDLLEVVSSTITATDLVSSDDGQVIIVAYDDGSVRHSSDGGISFISATVESDPDVSRILRLAMSSDGSVVYATVRYGFSYRSLDQGATWNRVDSLGTVNSDNWDAVSVSNDGQTVIVSTFRDGTPGALRISRDSGTTWTAIPAVSETFANSQSTYLSMSGDGKVIVAGSYEAIPQISFDSGATWSSYDGPDSSNETKNHAVINAAVSSDGTHVYLSCEGTEQGDVPVLRGIVMLPVMQTPTTVSPTTVPATETTVQKIVKAKSLPETGGSTTQMLLVVSAMFVIVGVGLRLRRPTRP